MKQHKWHKDEALKIAIYVMEIYNEIVSTDALKEAIEVCKEALKPHPKCDEACMFLCQGSPLTNDEIAKIYEDSLIHSEASYEFNNFRFARAIEKAHGIGE